MISNTYNFSENDLSNSHNSKLQNNILFRNQEKSNNELPFEENIKAECKTETISENDSINFQQVSYVKEEVMISDMSDLSEDEVSSNDSEQSRKTIHTTQKESDGEEIDVVSIDKADKKISGAIPSNRIKDNIRHSIRTNNTVKLDKNDSGKCTKCGGTFKGRTNLRKHQQFCGLAQFLGCEACDFTTKFKSCLKRHLETMHVYLKSAEIRKMLDRARTNEHHTTDNTSEPTIYKAGLNWKKFVQLHCSKCDVNCKISTWRDRNCRKCFTLTQLQCTKCDKRYAHRNSIYNHLKSKCGPKEYFHCADCDYRSVMKTYLFCHIKRKHRTMAPEGNETCAKCGGTFRGRAYLRQHQQLCGLARFIACEVCDFTTKFRKNLKKHLETMHVYLKTDEVQKILDRVRTKEQQMTGNISEPTISKSGLNWKEFVQLHCSKCNVNYKISTWKDLKCRKCSTLTQLQCTKCDKRYAHRNSMYCHLKSKCGPKEYFHCADCDFRSVAKNYLLRHIKRKHCTVDPEDYETCSRCDKRYKYRFDRLRHEKTCGKKPDLQCEFCSFRSKHKDSLKKHVRNHVLCPEKEDATVNAGSMDIAISDDVEIPECTSKSGETTASSTLKPCRVLLNNILLRNVKKSNNELPSKENIETKHGEAIDIVSISKADKKISNPVELKRGNQQQHQKLCDLTKSFKCELCNYKTKIRSHLKKHLERIHKHLKAEEIPEVLNTAKTKKN